VVNGNPWETVRIGDRPITIMVNGLDEGEFGQGWESGDVAPGGLIADIYANDLPLTHEAMESWTEVGWVGPLEVAEYKDMTLSTEVIDFTGLQVSRNPGLPIIYAGFGLVLIGVFLSFYVPHRQVRIRISASKSGASVLVGAASRSDPAIFDRDFERLKNTLS
jgi:cytochrome c biogenesis protein ResB